MHTLVTGLKESNVIKCVRAVYIDIKDTNLGQRERKYISTLLTAAAAIFVRRASRGSSATHQKPQWELDSPKEKETCLDAARKLGDLTHSDWDGGLSIQMDSTMSLYGTRCNSVHPVAPPATVICDESISSY